MTKLAKDDIILQQLKQETATAKALRAKAAAAEAEAEYWDTQLKSVGMHEKAKENAARLRAEAQGYIKDAQKADKEVLELDRKIREKTIERDLREAMAMSIHTWSLATDLLDTEAPDNITLGDIADLAIENGYGERGNENEDWLTAKTAIGVLEEDHGFSLDSDAEEKLADRVDYLLRTAKEREIPLMAILAPAKKGA